MTNDRDTKATAEAEELKLGDLAADEAPAADEQKAELRGGVINTATRFPTITLADLISSPSRDE